MEQIMTIGGIFFAVAMLGFIATCIIQPLNDNYDEWQNDENLNN